MNWILPAIYFLIFTFLIYNLSFFRIDGLSRKTLTLIFLLKILFGIFLILIYKYYYKYSDLADAYTFYADGTEIYKSIFNSPLDYLSMVTGIGSDAPHLNEYYSKLYLWDKFFNYNILNDNRIIIRINAVISLVSFGYFYVHVVFFAFLSFIGLTALFKTFKPFFTHKKLELMICIYMIPSVMLWTSGITKECIVTCAIGIIFYSVFKLIENNKSTKYYCLLVGGISLLLLSKFYFFIAILPGLIAYIWVAKTKKNKTILKFIATHLCLFLLLFSVKYLSPKYDFLRILSDKQHDYVNMVQTDGTVGSIIQIPELHPTISGLLKNAVPAFTNTFFRPHLFEVKSLSMLFSALENILIMCALLFFIYFSNWRKVTSKSFLLLSVSVVIIIFTLSGLITPVLGSLVRYKAPALPFLLIIFLLIFDKEKFTQSSLYKYFKGIKKPA